MYCTVLDGIAVRWVELLTILAAGLVVPTEDIGTAAHGFYGSIRAGMARSQLLSTSASTERLASNTLAYLVPAVEAAGLPAPSITGLYAAATNGPTAALNAVPGINTSTLSVLPTATASAYAASFKTVYIASLSFGGVWIIAAFLAQDVTK
ncbi:hypothetical protein BJ878DRAFT_279856 [Calycina marina]|uniref:Uncharacterized protein n=1 Tax=Calycina marina TaxID=1763456 RepID=A0A9P7Z6K2_9HELO|nr:hypothetical protein BJ878DRAFT_279856 [Calycina marina]